MKRLLLTALVAATACADSPTAPEATLDGLQPSFAVTSGTAHIEINRHGIDFDAGRRVSYLDASGDITLGPHSLAGYRWIYGKSGTQVSLFGPGYGTVACADFALATYSYRADLRYPSWPYYRNGTTVLAKTASGLLVKIKLVKLDFTAPNGLYLAWEVMECTGNQPPKVTLYPMDGDQNTPTGLGVGIYDSDGDPVTVTWDLGDGTSATGQYVTHTYTAAGTFPLTVAADDGNGHVTVATSTVRIYSPLEIAQELRDQVAVQAPQLGLNQGEVNALLTKLDQVIKKLERGQLAAVPGMLNAFTNQLEAMENSGRIDLEYSGWPSHVYRILRSMGL